MYALCILFLILIKINDQIQETYAQDYSKAIRLIRQGHLHRSEGRVEIYLSSSGRWQSLCEPNWRSERGKELCNLLGYAGGRGVNATAVFGPGEGHYAYISDRCFAPVEQCINNGQSLDNHCAQHRDDFGVTCWNGSPNVSIRLMKGNVEHSSEGRVEVSFLGQWGSVCDSSYWWDPSDVAVVCRAKGYTSGIAVSNGAYGEADGPNWISNVHCLGHEDSIFMCKASIIGGTADCPAGSSVGVFCWNDSPRLPVRLINNNNQPAHILSNSVVSGRVEIFFNNMWGSIHPEGWTLQEAHVICRMFGHSEGTSFDISPYRGGPVERMWMDNVWCYGNESSILQCPSTPLKTSTVSFIPNVSIRCT